MKKITLLMVLLMAVLFTKAQNFKLTSQEMGPFKLGMLLDDAQKFTKIPLAMQDNSDGQVVQYRGTEVEIVYFEEPEYGINPKGTLSLHILATQSPKFRFANGTGVGSTKAQILSAFKKKGNFIDASPEIITITTDDFSRKIEFEMRNDKATKVTIYPNSAG